MINRKRVARIYREYGLGVTRKAKTYKRIRGSEPAEQATRANESWAMDFLADRLENGHKYRIFSLLDRHTRECLALEARRSMPAQRVVEFLDGVAAVRGLPDRIRIDNGPEFISHALRQWAERNGVRLEFIEPGRPMQNGHIESFNGRLRAECADLWWTETLSEAQTALDEWRCRYNERRDHSSLGDVTPIAYAKMAEWVPFRKLGESNPSPDGKEENASAFPSFPQDPLLLNEHG